MGVKNIAASCNSWLSKLGLNVTRKETGKAGRTSFSPRVYLANILATEVESGETSQSRYEILMDHTYESFLTFYKKNDITDFFGDQFCEEDDF